jgi:cellulose synthase/poly-beta-1,6-N-acetylglucosamine synthase-like glycosyltransferase
MTARSAAPAGPTVVSDRVLGRRELAVFGLLTVLNVATGLEFVRFWFSLHGWAMNPWASATLRVIVLLAWLNHLARWISLPLMRRPRHLAVRTSRRAAVVTTFVPGAEPLAMLEGTVRALVALEHPHDTWVLDEGDDPEVRALCARLGARHFSRRALPQYVTEEGPFRKGTKYGNYNAWFAHVAYERYDVITAFDPDHVPERHFLTRVLGYFEDPRIGYVQAAQVYRNQDAGLVARGAAEETYGYYSTVQMAAYALGYPVVIGCHSSHRVEALRAVGGFPVHDAEDLLITARYRAAGWEGVYVPEVLARGLAPVDWAAYLHQQRRWARSVLDIKLRGPGLLRPLPFRARMAGLVHGLNYLSRTLSIMALLGLGGLLLISGYTPRILDAGSLARLAVWLGACGACELYRQRFYLQPELESGTHWRTVLLQVAKWPYFLFAFLDVLFRRRLAYRITPKGRSLGRDIDLFWPHLVASGVLGVAWVVGRLGGADLPLVLDAIPLIPGGAALALAWTGGPRRRSAAAEVETGSPGIRAADGAEGAGGALPTLTAGERP